MKQKSAPISRKYIIWAVVITLAPPVLGIIMGIEQFIK